ncbi:hypothetical protein MC885_016025 [Smutsia gigantea]|nr:hypothetical protein MC885_016025 [Smutsia gigantea]
MGCWREADSEGAPSEQIASVGVSHVRAPESDPLTQEAWPDEMCDPLLKDVLQLVGHQGSHPSQKPYSCGLCGRGCLCSTNFYQHQKRYSGEAPFKGDDGGASFGKSCAVHMFRQPVTYREEGMDLPNSSDLFQHQTTHNGKSPYKRIEFIESFPPSSSLGRNQGSHDGLMLFNCSDSGQAFLNTFTLLDNQIRHTEPNLQERP